MDQQLRREVRAWRAEVDARLDAIESAMREVVANLDAVMKELANLAESRSAKVKAPTKSAADPGVA